MISFITKTLFCSFVMNLSENNESNSSKIEEMIEFENLVFTASEASIKKAISMIPKFNKTYIQLLISSASDIKIYSYKLLGDLFKATGPPQIKLTKSLFFHCYLYTIGLIKTDDFSDWNTKQTVNTFLSIDEYENPVQENTLKYFIQKDEVQSFINVINEENIDVKHVFIKIFSTPFRIIDYVCYCNSMNILKYLMVNDVFLTKWSTERAIQSGSHHIIEFLSEKGYSFDNHLWSAIQYHQNDVTKWLYDNYKHEDFKLSDCVYYFNTEILLYFIDTIGIDINQKDYDEKTCLHYAVSFNNTILVQYLLNKGINTELQDMSKQTPKDLIISKEMQEIFEK